MQDSQRTSFYKIDFQQKIDLNRGGKMHHSYSYFIQEDALEWNQNFIERLQNEDFHLQMQYTHNPPILELIHKKFEYKLEEYRRKTKISTSTTAQKNAGISCGIGFLLSSLFSSSWCYIIPCPPQYDRNGLPSQNVVFCNKMRKKLSFKDEILPVRLVYRQLKFV